MKLNKMNQKGFTLIELMIVVAIISILATLALPRFQVFQAKALRSEATYNLGVVATYQEAYRIENRGYSILPAMGADFTSTAPVTDCNGPANQIGFVLTNCEKVKYRYGTVGADANDAANQTFDAEAQSIQILSGLAAATADCLSIDHNRESNIVNDAIKEESGGCAATLN